MVTYYNFDVQSTTPAPIFVLFREGSDTPVPGQLNIVDVVPGDDGYNDVWQVVRVTVPRSYVANIITSLQEIVDAGYAMESTSTLVNCPIVPDGSTADLWYDGGDTGLTTGWYQGEVVYSWGARGRAGVRLHDGKRHRPDPQRGGHRAGRHGLLAHLARAHL